MNKNYIPIGRMAEINHVTIATLRLYDKKGLLCPRYVDPETGYRYYDLQQNARLDMIAYMKELGMSLSEIAEVLKKEDIETIEQILARKNAQIHDQIKELYARQDAVERTIHSFERYRKSPVTGTTSLEYIEARYIFGIPCKTNFYDGDITSFENVMTDLKNEMLKEQIPQIHTYPIGTSILKEDFLHENFVPDLIFIFLGRHDRERIGKARKLDSGMYACIYIDNYDDELSGARKLLSFCREKGYRIDGDYICEVMTEFNIFDSDHRAMFMRLQIPVSFEKNK